MLTGHCTFIKLSQDDELWEILLLLNRIGPWEEELWIYMRKINGNIALLKYLIYVRSLTLFFCMLFFFQGGAFTGQLCEGCVS